MLGLGLLVQVDSEFGPLSFRKFPKIPFLKYLSEHRKSARCCTGFLHIPWHRGTTWFWMKVPTSQTPWPGDKFTEAL